MKKLKLILCIMLLANLVSACNTVEGFGQDLEKLGGKISDKADK